MPPPTTAGTKTRERRHACRYKYVRKVAGSKYQARLHLGGGRRNGVCVNLGLYDSERLAGLAAKAAVRALPVGKLTALAAWRAWRDKGLFGRELRADLLPTGVVRRGGWYFARGVTGPAAGPFASPEWAHTRWQTRPRRRG